MTNEATSAVDSYFKATRLDGRSFRSSDEYSDLNTGRVDYADRLGTDLPVVHPWSTRMVPNAADTYLSISTEPTGTLIGGTWPCRLFRVEPVGDMLSELSAHPHKRAVLAVKVVEELPAHMALGPQGERVAALIERASRLDLSEARALGAARGAARGAAYGAAYDAAYGAARGAAYDAARGAAYDAARGAAYDAAYDAAYGAARGAADAAMALLTQDLIHPDTFDALMGPWLTAIPDYAV